jgi:ribosomal protein L12E/L44/L45/RPP1/RPP2
MTAKDLLKLAASAPIAVASSGAAYVAATTDSDENAKKIEQLEERLEQLQEQNKGYVYMLQKAENEIVLLKSNKAK